MHKRFESSIVHLKPSHRICHQFVCFIRFDSIAFGESQSEDEQFENDLETDPPNWQQLVSREVLLGLKPSEIKRQEVINGKCNHLLMAIYIEIFQILNLLCFLLTFCFTQRHIKLDGLFLSL